MCACICHNEPTFQEYTMPSRNNKKFYCCRVMDACRIDRCVQGQVANADFFESNAI